MGASKQYREVMSSTANKIEVLQCIACSDGCNTELKALVGEALMENDDITQTIRI